MTERADKGETIRNTAADVVDFAPYFVAHSGHNDEDGTMMQSAQELRYQVYCEECHFLEAEEYPERRESDDYDDDSAHFYAYNLQKELVGYVRLVPADEDGEFPWQRFCTNLLPGIELPPAGQAGEISRLMVRRDYRRRRGDVLSGVNTADGNGPVAGERRMESPQILLSMYRQMYQNSLKAGVRYWYAAMERPLARSLQRMDFKFRQLGPETDYFGPVAPYLMDLRQMETDVGRSNPALLAWLQRPDGNNS
ncbi:MAG: PEP-CTERM/exosortase system-associated acyltransferase [Rubrivivax sp.]|nr:PEP-CTERM/exosortase system-associated acyltransferase [Rubrivivax sp.]